jgi:hypothetical protein
MVASGLKSRLQRTEHGYPRSGRSLRHKGPLLDIPPHGAGESNFSAAHRSVLYGADADIVCQDDTDRGRK